MTIARRRPAFFAPLLAVSSGIALAAAPLRADDGYALWLRYRPIADATRASEYRAAGTELVVDGRSTTLAAAGDELRRGLRGMLGAAPPNAASVTRDGAIVVGGAGSALARRLVPAGALAAVGAEGYVIRHARLGGHRVTVVAGASDAGALYGAFALLRRMQQSLPLAGFDTADSPRVRLRVLDHWDNLDRTVERGYAGRSLWAWDSLPGSVSPRYRDYARADASLGINGAVLTNVNADARVLTAPYLQKAAAIAGALRPYGVRVYLTARFSAPVEIGGLKTADPLDPAVRAWWAAKASEIYRLIPDFGGLLVKANAEGQPGPQDYGRTHADGANVLADALLPHGGVVMWRAFVYSHEVPADRVRQAYDEFRPLDGTFRDNVIVQVKNGPLDFQPREPFSPLFGAMPKTPLMLEVQITKEYLGQDTHVVYLGPMWQEVLRADTYARGAGSTVARVVDGTMDHHALTGMAGVANVGIDRDWTGSDFNQANWYAFGRLAWNPSLDADAIAREWAAQTFSPDVAEPIAAMMRVSREAAVNYMTPLGLAHVMAANHHYGPGPWADVERRDQSPTYFHRADSAGIGFDRTASGSDAVAQYAPPVAARYANRATVPESLLLWFHHVGWDERLASGRTLWDELALHYQAGVDTVRAMQHVWAGLAGRVDADRFARVAVDLATQEREARWWRDASLLYFQQFSRRPLPPGVEPPAHDLALYERLRCPAVREKPRCPET